jgi:short-subunit dehydrogenase
MTSKKRIIIIGGTSSIAEHCARLWLEKQPTDLTLVGRHIQHLDRIAKDLYARNPKSDIDIIQTNFTNPTEINATVKEITHRASIDIVLIAQGALPDQNICQDDLQCCRDALEINGISPVLFAEAFAHEMQKTGKGTIALISSVAGERGRKSNYVYGSAKSLINSYAQGLQHRFSKSKVKIVVIKPGPTDTPMTLKLRNTKVNLAPVHCVAKQIVDGIQAGNKVIYTPRKWWLIMLIIRILPLFIFNKLNI